MNLRPGFNTTLTKRGPEDIPAARPARKWRHPWWTQPSWQAATGQWVATVKAGNVNGIAPAYRATIAEQQALGNPWEINRLSGQQFFSASVFANPTETVGQETVDVPLYLNPQMPLSFRAIGWDAAGGSTDAVPQFFLNLGAAKAPAQPSLEEQLSGDAPVPTPPAGLRLLRVCDIWVHQPRVALTSSVEQNLSGYLTGQPTVIQTLGVQLPSPGDRLQILTGTFVAQSAGAGIDPLSSDYMEPNYDEMPVSQVFLLSPAGTAPGSAPDSSWQPFVRHSIFWNLSWAQPGFRQPDYQAGGLNIPPLAFGAASLVITSFQAQLSNLEQDALNILLAASLQGSFWVATGGGADITAAATTTAVPMLGPNIYANLAAKTAAAQQALRTQHLDPDFPYGALRFNTALFAQ